MPNSVFDSVLNPLAHLNDNAPRVPFDINQTSTGNSLPPNFAGGPLASNQGVEFNYNHQAYSVQIVLNNLVAANARTVAPDSIVDLVINDTLTDWIVSGHITLRNTFNTIENNYAFRNDGYDTLSIRIYPTSPKAVAPAVVNPATGLSVVDYNQPEWELNDIFSVYYIEDIPLPPGADGAASAGVKCKKLYFRDIRYHLLTTKIIQYSTALSPKVGNAVTANSTDNERSLYTGDIIKEVIQKGIADSSLAQFSSDWDTGASKLFYTSPADWTANDDLKYAYDRHVSTKASGNTNDFCILSVERGPNFGDKGQFTLRALSDYFNRASNDYFLENFYLQTPDDTKHNNIGPTRTPKKKSYTSYSRIHHFEYLEISPDTNANQFVSRPVYSFDLNKRQFNIEFQGNDVATAKNFINQKYISQLTKKGNDNFQIILDSSKKDYNIKPSFSLYGGSDKVVREADGILDLLKIGVFQNACITFTVPGLTSREVGRFIGIDYYSGGNMNNKFDDKLCGEWFVIDVKHIFRGAVYNNEITAIKLHKFQNTDNFPNTL
jgi:hypothetical protein